ncbi:fungal-specific transcription factor domain-containing protein, partial [Ilyonectria destructans]
MASPRQVRPPKRRPVACLHCREKKVKCDGSQPCSYCAAREIGCVFPRKASRRRDKRRLHPAPDGPSDEFRPVARSSSHNFHAQTSFRSPENLGEHHDHALSHPPPIHCSPPPLHGRRNWSAASPGRNNGNNVLFDLTGVVSPPDTSNSTAEYSELASTLDLDPVMRHIPELGGSLSGGSGNSFEGSIIEPNTGSEYHGASSILAICSAAAIEWVVQQTHNQRYPRLSESMAATIASQLKLNKRFDRERAPEPSFEAAWRYYEAYFQQAESVFPVINRPSFESRLRQTFNQGEKSDDDPAWYALRHIIYAAGKRQLLNNDPQEHTFSHIQEQCWPYFENAMSVYTELLFAEVSIMGVQALIAMAMFVEGLGSPCLEYMLCTGASRLAQSQGLHRQPPRDWKLSKSQVSQRNLLFWTIYSYDKHISLRAGRPSAIDDDDITCAPPRFSDQNGIEGAWVSKVVEHARLSSEITKWLAIFRSKNIPLDDSIHKLRKLNDRLTSWRESLPTPFRPG